jgi:predicted Zn-dependent peptidase
MVDFKKITLDNGLTVIIHEDNSTPLIAVNILYKVGSKDEDKELTGLTHLFEHLMFSGSKNAPDFDEPIQLAGGENNAFTNTDITNFYDVVPAENLEVALWLEADRMRNLNLKKKSLDTQKKVVIEEFKETCLNEPYGDMLHHLSPMCYPDHPYQWPTIGKDIAHIKKVELEDAQRFYLEYYNPGNAILVLSGNIQYEKGFDLAKKWFSDLQGVKSETKFDQSFRPIDFCSKTLVANVPSKAIFLAFKMQHRLHDEFYTVDLISDILSSGRSSRFYQILIKEKQLFSYIDAYISGTTDSGLLIIDGKLMDNVSIENARDAIWHELDRMSNEKLGVRELDKIKNKAESNLIFSETSALNKSMSLAYYEYLNNIDLINTEVDIYRSISAEEIMDVSKKLFKKDSHAELIYLPK